MNPNAMKLAFGAGVLACVCASSLQAQDTVRVSAPALTNETITLIVPKGTAVQVVLDQEVRIQRVGQAVHGRLAEPDNAFDQLVVPVGR